jgi:hypothetical protein
MRSRRTEERWPEGQSLAPSFAREIAALQRLWARSRTDA